MWVRHDWSDLAAWVKDAVDFNVSVVDVHVWECVCYHWEKKQMLQSKLCLTIPYKGFPGGPGSGRSHGGRNGNPFLYSCLGNPRIRGAWQALVSGSLKESDRIFSEETATAAFIVNGIQICKTLKCKKKKKSNYLGTGESWCGRNES